MTALVLCVDAACLKRARFAPIANVTSFIADTAFHTFPPVDIFADGISYLDPDDLQALKVTTGYPFQVPDGGGEGREPT
jgi:hypothetical protein